MVKDRILQEIESLDEDKSELYLEKIEEKLLIMHQSAGKEIETKNGFYTISIVKKRILYKTFLESARSAGNPEEFTEEVREFREIVVTSDEESVEDLKEIESGALKKALEEIK